MKKYVILSAIFLFSFTAASAQGIEVETGYFMADGTGTQTVDVGFEPEMVEFTANQKINSINRDFATTTNAGCPENVNGWSEGTAVFDSNGLEKQMAIGSFRNSDSTNQHRVASSQTDIIKNVYTGQNGNECGKLEITLNQKTSNGFEVDIQNKYNQWDDLVMYRAYNIPSDIEYDAGLDKVSSTGQKDVDDLGFEPYYLKIRNAQLLQSYNTNVNKGGNYIGRSQGYGLIKSDGSVEQYSIGYGANSHSTNAHHSYSSDVNIIRNKYSGQNGADDGSTKASLESGLSNGFRLNVGSNQHNEVFMYRAFGPGNYQVELGHRTISSTGNKVLDFGFTPDHISLHSGQRISGMNQVYNSPTNSGCSNGYGWMDGWMDVADGDQYAIGTGRSSDSMNADHVFSSNSQLLKNVYTGQNSGECGRLTGSVTSIVDGQGAEIDVNNVYVNEMLLFNAWDLSVVDSDPQFSGDRYVADETEKGDDATIYTGSPEFGIDVNHPDDVEVTVEFLAGDGSSFATDYVNENGEATATWSGLQNGETYEWEVRACDNYGNCQTSSTWTFTVDYNDQLGRRDDDYHPQGANVSQDSSFFTGYIDRIMDNSSQLEPGMKSTFYDMSDPTADPDKYHRDYAFIADAQEAKWFDSQGTTDRSDRWSISDDVSESIGNTGQSYEPGETYYHPGYSGTVRTEANDPTIPKTAKVFANSYAAVATSELEADSSGIREGFGVWIDPDNIKKFDEYYENSWEQKVQFGIDLTGPDAGIGFDSMTYGGNPLNDFEYRYNDDTEVIGDIYWQNEYRGMSEVPGELQQSMCGDDGTEYLVEEVGEINNSARYAGNYACATTNDVCYHSKVSGRKLFSTGQYLDTGDASEYEGRAKNDKENCRQYDWDASRFSSIQADLFPGWYDQDFKQQYCRENTIYGKDGVRWFSSSYVNENPHAVTGGIDDDWNAYVEGKISSVSSVDPYTSRPDQESWVGMQTPVPTGNDGNNNIATLGFCGGDDSAEYLVTQDCVAGACSTNRDVQGVSKDPDNCVADGEVISSTQPDVNSVDYQDEDGNWQDMEGTDARRIVPEGRSIELDYGGATTELTCFAGSFLSEWPVIFQEETVSVPYGDSTTVTFRLVNPDEEAVEYEVDLITQTDSSVTGAGLESFTSVVDQDGQTTFNAEVPARSGKAYQVEIRGGNQQIDDPSDNLVEIRAESTDGRITGGDSVGVQVVETQTTGAGQQGTSPDAIPGIMPLQVLMMIMAAAATVFFWS